VLEGTRKAVRIGAEFALVDDGLLIGVDVLNRVLDGHDVRPPMEVDVIDHRGQTCRLSAAGGSRYKYQSAGEHRDFFANRGHRQFVDRADLERNHSKDGSDMAALPEHIDPEAGQALDVIAEVHLFKGVELFPALLGQDREQEILALSVIERWVIDPVQVPADPHEGWVVCLEVQVAGVHRHQFSQKIVNELSHAPLLAGFYMVLSATTRGIPRKLAKT